MAYLAGRGLEWPQETASRVHNMGLKIYAQYNYNVDHIEYVSVDDTTWNYVGIAQEVSLESDRVYVFDKGFYSYNWWKAMIDKGSSFVTRLKKKLSLYSSRSF